jgi:hypothetical protein
MAHRLRRKDQHPQRRLRLGPQPASTPPKPQKIWAGTGISARNLAKISALAG